MKHWKHVWCGTRAVMPFALFAVLAGCASAVEMQPDVAVPAVSDAEKFDPATRIEVVSRLMPSSFWVSDELVSQKVVREEVSVSDHISGGIREGASGGAKFGLQLGVTFGIPFPPVLLFTPALVAGGALIGAAGGAIAGAGAGGAKEANSFAMAKRSEHEIAYASLSSLAVTAAQREIDFERTVPSLEPDSGNFGPTVASETVDYLLRISVNSVHVKRENTAAGEEESEPMFIVRVNVDMELERVPEHRIVWRSQYRAQHRYPGDERSAGEEALRQSGREIAALTLTGLKSGSFTRGSTQLAGKNRHHSGTLIPGGETVPATTFPGKSGSSSYYGGDPRNQ